MPAIKIIQLSYIKEEVCMQDCVSVCVCCFCFLVCEQKRACFASSKSMSPRGNVEPETECERDRASPGQTHFALFPLSNFSVFTHRFLQIS